MFQKVFQVKGAKVRENVAIISLKSETTLMSESLKKYATDEVFSGWQENVLSQEMSY